MLGSTKHVPDAKAVVEGCKFQDNHATNGGGGEISVGEESSRKEIILTITDSCFERNRAAQGGALEVETDDVTVSASVFAEKRVIGILFTVTSAHALCNDGNTFCGSEYHAYDSDDLLYPTSICSESSFNSTSGVYIADDNGDVC